VRWERGRRLWPGEPSRARPQTAAAAAAQQQQQSSVPCSSPSATPQAVCFFEAREHVFDTLSSHWLCALECPCMGRVMRRGTRAVVRCPAAPLSLYHALLVPTRPPRFQQQPQQQAREHAVCSPLCMCGSPRCNRGMEGVITITVQRPGQQQQLQRHFVTHQAMSCSALEVKLREEFGPGALCRMDSAVLTDNVQLQLGGSYVYRVFPPPAGGSVWAVRARMDQPHTLQACTLLPRGTVSASCRPQTSQLCTGSLVLQRSATPAVDPVRMTEYFPRRRPGADSYACMLQPMVLSVPLLS
jgi:hypothetical protein